MVKKAFIIIPPETGHVNPVSSLAHELSKSQVKVIFYGNEKHREIIEKTGAEFRRYAHPNFEYFDHSADFKDQNSLIINTMNQLLDFSHELLPSLLDDAQREQPDMIIYDTLFLPG
jgi:UDP:flavonoid glycosyltransferase YjiC (YdhE family)